MHKVRKFFVGSSIPPRILNPGPIGTASGMYTTSWPFGSGGGTGGSTTGNFSGGETSGSGGGSGVGGLILGQAGSLFASFSDFIPTADKTVNSNDQTAENIRSTAFKGLMSSGNPYMMAAGVLNTIIDKTGGFTDASQGLGGGTDAANMFASLALPGAGWFTGRTEKYKMSNELAASSGYTGAVDKALTAMLNAGAKILFGRSKAKKMIHEAKERENSILGILDDAKDRQTASNYYGIGANTQMAMNGGLRVTHLNKEGGKFETPSLKWADKVLLQQETKELSKFKEGGKMNVIPTGSLHAHLHHMDRVDELFGELTNKGIPVVTEENGGLIQQAEIERNEIIFNLEVTKKLEELAKKGTDEAAIEAGKLLVHEILENTIDNTGLLKEIK